jgi:mycofactocin precursor
LTDPTTENRDSPAPTTDSLAGGATDGDQFVEAELLVEDVSIDGMCGVY